MAQQLHELLPGLEVVATESVGPLQVFGLRGRPASRLNYLTLDEALTTKHFRVDEISESGSVPQLKLQNDVDQRVFVMAGEQLIGAKQNRVLNASLLVERKTQMLAPVSCVERGRWSYRSRSFGSKGSSSHGYLRRKMSKDSYEGYRKHSYPRSKQGEVWAEVDRKMFAMQSASPSDALDQVYDDYAGQLDDLLSQVNVPDDCRGVVFAFAGQIAGADVFDQPATLSKLLPKLLRAYALDALEANSDQQVEADVVTAWLGQARDAQLERFDSPGLGHDYRLETPQLVGAALAFENQALHIELFPSDDGPGQKSRRPQPSPAPAPRASTPEGSGSGTVALSAAIDEAQVVAFATSEATLAALSEAVCALRPGMRAGAGLQVARSGLLIRVDRSEHDRFDATNPLLNHAAEAALVYAATQRAPKARHRLVVTGCGLADNWFSHWHAEARTTVVSLFDWHRVAAVPPAAFVAYELLVHGLQAASDDYDPERLFHRSTRNCLFDFCANKPDIEAKLTTGRMCDECRRALRQHEVVERTLMQVLPIIARLCQ